MKTSLNPEHGRSHWKAVLILMALLSLPLHGANLEDVFGPGGASGDNAYESEWFGRLERSGSEWVRHEGLGWIYLEQATPGSTWAWHNGAGWLYFAQAAAPWFYRLDSGSWQYAYGEELAGLAFYDAKGRLGWWAAEPPTSLTIGAHDALYRAAETLEAAVGEVGSRTAYPSRTNPSTGQWGTVPASDWTSGFWPGCLWLMYDFTGEAQWRTWAEQWTAGLESQQYNTSTHDVGFMMFCSFGEGYRLTGKPEYLQVLLNSAASLDTRYSPLVQAYRSWSWGRWDDNRNFTVIADNMMNLELMVWAAQQPGGEAKWTDHAVQHALTTDRDIIRDDNSTYHVVVYNSLTGNLVELTTHQGDDPESDWARGQAWVVYGYVEMFEATGDERMLDAALRASDFFIASLPEGRIPPWDFSLPDPESAPRDSSAAAITASALLKLSGLVEENLSAHYRKTALNILEGLMSAGYQNGETSAILDHGTAHFPAGYYDTGLIWGDYYYLEALLRYLDSL